jgi:hypothetical protein
MLFQDAVDVWWFAPETLTLPLAIGDWTMPEKYAGKPVKPGEVVTRPIDPKYPPNCGERGLDGYGSPFAAFNQWASRWACRVKLSGRVHSIGDELRADAREVLRIVDISSALEAFAQHCEKRAWQLCEDAGSHAREPLTPAARLALAEKLTDRWHCAALASFQVVQLGAHVEPWSGCDTLPMAVQIARLSAMAAKACSHYCGRPEGEELAAQGVVFDDMVKYSFGEGSP